MIGDDFDALDIYESKLRGLSEENRRLRTAKARLKARVAELETELHAWRTGPGKQDRDDDGAHPPCSACRHYRAGAAVSGRCSARGRGVDGSDPQCVLAEVLL